MWNCKLSVTKEFFLILTNRTVLVLSQNKFVLEKIYPI
jgi:hypothetical protein